MELSKAFCDVVVERWQAFTGKAAKLDGDGRNFAQTNAKGRDKLEAENGEGDVVDARVGEFQFRPRSAGR